MASSRQPALFFDIYKEPVDQFNHLSTGEEGLIL